MPIVNPAELEKKAKEKKDAEKSVPILVIDGKTYYKGADGATYDTHGEALDSLQKEKQQAEYKKLGLDDFGRTPEQVAFSDARAKLLKKRESKIEEVRAIDVEIASLKVEDFVTKKKK